MIESLLNAEFTVTNVIICYIATSVLSALGGALGGVCLGAKDLGAGLAASMGSMFGPIAGAHGWIVAIVLLNFL